MTRRRSTGAVLVIAAVVLAVVATAAAVTDNAMFSTVGEDEEVAAVPAVSQASLDSEQVQ